jgi:phosphate-selective porin OprO/OprP
MRRRDVAVMALAGWLGATLPAGAAMTTEERLRALEEIVRRQQEEIKQLRGELRGRRTGVKPEEGARAAETPPKEEVKAEVEKEVEAATRNWPEVDTKGKLEVRSRDGDFAFRLGGRLQIDAALYSNDEDTDLGSGSEFRRARLELQGTVWREWDFKFQYDFTDTGAEGLRDAYIRYTGFEPYGVTGITAGQFKEPFSLEELTSSKYITFMERALPNAFAPARNRGVGVSTAFADAVTASAGFFGEGVDSDETDGDDASEGWGGTGRVTFSPVHTATRVVHLGAAGGWRTPDEGDMLRFRQRPESHVTDVRLVNTGEIDTDDFTRLGAEAAVVHGPFSLQGEYMRTHVNRQLPGKGDLEFDGWYVFGSWFLTGESRVYEFEDGAFGNLKPTSVVGKGGYGAWELAARYSGIDLNDGDVAGGEQQDFTVGLNWYPNANLRLLLNYVRVLEVDGGPFDGAAPDVAQVRAQVHW